MKKNKVTQIQTIFYRLYKHFKSEKKDDFIPIFDFIGEIYIEELNIWGFMSYELPARFADLKKRIPNCSNTKSSRGKAAQNTTPTDSQKTSHLKKYSTSRSSSFIRKLKDSMTNTKKKSEKVKAVSRVMAAYRFPPSLLARIKYAHELETKGKLVQVSENTFVIQTLDKVLPKLPR